MVILCHTNSETKRSLWRRLDVPMLFALCSIISSATAFVPAASLKHSPILSSTRLAVAAMKDLPSEVVQYSQVPKKEDPGVFTATSIPKGLLKNHSTKAGTWGVIRVRQGQLNYVITAADDQEKEEAAFVLDVAAPGIIEPLVLHQVAPLTDDVEFVVEFYRLPDTGPVDEQREGL